MQRKHGNPLRCRNVMAIAVVPSPGPRVRRGTATTPAQTWPTTGQAVKCGRHELSSNCNSGSGSAGGSAASRSSLQILWIVRGDFVTIAAYKAGTRSRCVTFLPRVACLLRIGARLGWRLACASSKQERSVRVVRLDQLRSRRWLRVLSSRRKSGGPQQGAGSKPGALRDIAARQSQRSYGCVPRHRVPPRRRALHARACSPAGTREEAPGCACCFLHLRTCETQT
jgi:hypothetical protein